MPMSPVKKPAAGAAPVGERLLRAGATPMPPAPGRRWRSSELFAGSPEIEIEHGEAVYRLRRTDLGNLILTK